MDQFTNGGKPDAENTETPDLPANGNRSSTDLKTVDNNMPAL